MNDRKLVSGILKGDKKAIKSLYQKYELRLLYFILSKVADKKDAEEILQDTFISALDSIPLFNYKASLYTWLWAICRHEISDFYRKKKIETIVFSRLPFLKNIVSRALGPELVLEEKQAKERIFRTFKSLSEGYFEILRLKYIEGFSMKEISLRLNKTVKAVESKLSRARLAFQKEYVKANQGSVKNNWQVFNSSFNKGKLSF